MDQKATRLLTAGVVMIALSGLCVPAARAACSEAHLIEAPGARVFSNPDWCAQYYCYVGTTCAGTGDCNPTWNLDGLFWSMGTGNPATGVGDDNGAMPSRLWLRQIFDPNIQYYRQVTIAAPQGATNWGYSSAIDGCVMNQGQPGFDGSECLCAALFDQDREGQAYFALLSDKVNNLGNFDFSPWLGGGDIRLAEMPAPTVINSTLHRSSNALDLQLKVQKDDQAGMFLDPECGNCSSVTYRVLELSVPRGTPAPTDRMIDRAGWELLPLPNGSPQPAIDLNSTVEVRLSCGDTDEDTYLAAQLFFEGGFASSIVSANATKVECGPNLARPVDSGRPGRGKRGLKKRR